MAKAMRDVELHYLIVQFLIIRISSRGGLEPLSKIFFSIKIAEFFIQTSVSVTSSNRSRMTANTGASNEIVIA